MAFGIRVIREASQESEIESVFSLPEHRLHRKRCVKWVRDGYRVSRGNGMTQVHRERGSGWCRVWPLRELGDHYGEGRPGEDDRCPPPEPPSPIGNVAVVPGGCLPEIVEPERDQGGDAGVHFEADPAWQDVVEQREVVQHQEREWYGGQMAVDGQVRPEREDRCDDKENHRELCARSTTRVPGENSSEDQGAECRCSRRFPALCSQNFSCDPSERIPSETFCSRPGMTKFSRSL